MEFNFFLWPMLVPMILPLLYCFQYKKESLRDLETIIVSMVLIVLFYWPLDTSNFLGSQTYPVVKIFLFIVLPLLSLYIVQPKPSRLKSEQFGITPEGLKKSVYLSILFLPIMLGGTALIHSFSSSGTIIDLGAGIISFFEAFTEEFFFRGILFLYLLRRTNLTIAYITSFAGFILLHPQHFVSFFILVTIVQGILTIEICRRSENLVGAWLLHGANRIFTLVLIPIIFS